MANGRRRFLAHICRPYEFGEVSGVRINIGRVVPGPAHLRAQPHVAPARRAAISKLGDEPELRSGFAAVHADDLAGNERRLAGSDEYDGIGDLRGGAHALERYSVDQSGLSLGGAGEPIEHFGFDRTGRDRIDANA